MIVAAGSYYMVQRLRRYHAIRTKVQQGHVSDSLRRTYHAERLGVIGTGITFSTVAIMIIAIQLGASLRTVKIMVGIGGVGLLITALASLAAGWNDDDSWRDH
jgi:hypothetical protein